MRFLSKNIGLIAILLLMTTEVFGKTSEAYERYEVLKVIKKYAESTACETTFDDSNVANKTNLKDVFTIDRDTETGISKYYVFWGGDYGCAGGSGTYSGYLSEITRNSENRPFLVNNPDVLDSLIGNEVGTINSRFIESVIMNKENNLVIVSSNYADEKFGGKDGGNNFPANKFKYILSFDESDDSWKIINQVLLEQNN